MAKAKAKVTKSVKPKAPASTPPTQLDTLRTDTTPEEDAECIEKMVNARISLLFKQPFFGNLVTRMELVNADSWCSTGATDGRRFFYNTKFIKMLSKKELEFLFGHEVLHVVYQHAGLEGRGGRLDHNIWRLAVDYCVNADLIQQRVGERITTIPILYDKKYEGMCAEEVYDLLMKNASKMDITSLLSQVLDDHLEEEEDGAETGSNGCKPDNGKPSKLTAKERKEIQEEITAAVLDAAAACPGGQLPGGVNRMIGNLLNPQMDWRELLSTQIQSTIKSDYTWMRPSRKGWGLDAILPGLMVGETIDICIAVDMSGSTFDMTTDFFSEIVGIMEQYVEFKIHLWTFDTSVHSSQTFTAENLSDIMDYQPKGGGGTEFMVNWDWMKENDIAPKQLVIFTDGYPCGSWGDPDYCDTTFIIHGPRTIVPPFGAFAYYEKPTTKQGSL